MIPMLSVLPEIIIDVPNCPNPVAQRALRDTLMDFCRRSQAWLVRQEFGVTIKDQSAVILELPDNTRYVKIISLNHEDRVLTPASETMLDNQIRGWRTHKGNPKAFIEQLGGEIRVYPMPTETTVGKVAGTLALSPTRHATEIDQDLWDRWLEVLVAGTQYRLHQMPDRSWTNPPRSAVLMQTYETGIDDARRHSRNDHQSKPSRVTAYGGY